MHSGLMSFIPLRVRFSLALGACVLPFGIVFVFANLFVYQPLQRELLSISFANEQRFESISRLQLALTRSAMPVNDYIIHGDARQRGEFLRLTAKVETSFAAMQNELSLAQKIDRILLETLRDRWHLARKSAERIMQYDASERRSEHAARAMEEFNSEVGDIASACEDLIDRVRAGIADARGEIESRHARLNQLASLAAGVAALVSFLLVVYISQSLFAPLVELAEEEELGEEDRATFLRAAAHGHANKDLMRATDRNETSPPERGDDGKP